MGIEARMSGGYHGSWMLRNGRPRNLAQRWSAESAHCVAPEMEFEMRTTSNPALSACRLSVAFENSTRCCGACHWFQSSRPESPPD